KFVHSLPTCLIASNIGPISNKFLSFNATSFLLSGFCIKTYVSLVKICCKEACHELVFLRVCDVRLSQFSSKNGMTSFSMLKYLVCSCDNFTTSGEIFSKKLKVMFAMAI